MYGLTQFFMQSYFFIPICILEACWLFVYCVVCIFMSLVFIAYLKFDHDYGRDTLMSIAKHYETGESLPEDIYKKLLAARTFRAGSLSLRQVSVCVFFSPVALIMHGKILLVSIWF